jgi:hypothetical protein
LHNNIIAGTKTVLTGPDELTNNLVTDMAGFVDAQHYDIPAMGQRLRLKAGFVIPPNWSPQEQAVLLALKKYGAIVADNGGFFSVSITPDDRYPKGCFEHLNGIGIDQFEVIQTTGPNEGPRGR